MKDAIIKQARQESLTKALNQKPDWLTIQELKAHVFYLKQELARKVYPTVKPLEWKGSYCNNADALDGYYIAWEVSKKKYKWDFSNNNEYLDKQTDGISYPTLQEAKNAANAHYEQQVLSLLEL